MSHNYNREADFDVQMVCSQSSRSPTQERVHRLARGALGESRGKIQQETCSGCQAGLLCLVHTFIFDEFRVSGGFIRRVVWLSCKKCEKKFLRLGFEGYVKSRAPSTLLDVDIRIHESCPHRAWHTNDVCTPCNKKKRKERTRKHARKQKRRR